MPIPIVLQLVEKRLIGETPAISRARCRCVASSPASWPPWKFSI